jgi:hypothetical protein
MFALRLVSLDYEGRGVSGLTVLTIFPDLLMMVTVSIIGIVAVLY